VARAKKAAAPITAEMRGWNELAAALPVFAKQVTKQGADAARVVADAAVAETIGRVPRGTRPVDVARLATTVGAWVGYPRTSGKIKVGIGKGLAPGRVGWLEFGGSRGRPHVAGGRWLVPTSEAKGDEFARLAKQKTDDEIRRFPWPHASR
jgi:hypothetical protein